LDLGNEWQFERVDGAGNRLGLEQFVVVGDTTLEGEDYSTYIRRSYSATGELDTVHTCAARTWVNFDSGGPIVSAVSVSLEGGSYGDCQVDDCFPAPASPLYSFEGGGTIEVGGQSYSVEGTARGLSIVQEPGGTFKIWRSYNALDVGPYLCTYTLNNEIRRRFLLQYAEIDGNIYGVPTTSNVSNGPPAHSFEAAAYPNPFASDLRVTVRGAVGPVAVELFDVLGRRVAQAIAHVGGEEQVVEVAASPHLPVGLYVVRIREVNGNVVTVRVTKM
jgi:hypothetical protein